MTAKHLATSEQGRAARLCEMCLMDVAYLPAVYCADCVAYMADCEAEVSSER